MAQTAQAQRDYLPLLKLLLLSAIIVTANSLLAYFVRVTDEPVDEINFLDFLWRVVVGQRAGIDFHCPLGPGPYLLGALLWHWLGAHDYVLRLAIFLFGLSISLVGCVVAERKLAGRTNLAVLFCITLAFQVSAPTTGNEYSLWALLHAFGVSEYYNRHMMSALAVLLVQTFACGPISSKRDNAVDVALAAFLLNILFLTKITGFVLGVMILLAGCLLPGRNAYRLLSACAAVLISVAIMAIEFRAAGLEFLPLIQDYLLTAHSRLGLSLSFHELLVRGLQSWQLASSAAVLVLYAVSQRLWGRHIEFRRAGLIIGTYAACQIVLHMTNSGGSNIWLAPAALVSLIGKEGKQIPKQAGISEIRRLAEVFAKEAIPLAIFLFALVPQIVPSISAAKFAALVSLGIEEPYVMTAGKGISISTIPYLESGVGSEVRRWNDAVTAISSLKLTDQVIANIDYNNPFPVLFLAPPPKGVQVYFEFGMNIPAGAQLQWQDVIGDACVVAIPLQPIFPAITDRLTTFVRSELARDFKLVYRDTLWTIYQRTSDCTRT